jgi:hypothetical protein
MSIWGVQGAASLLVEHPNSFLANDFWQYWLVLLRLDKNIDLRKIK